ncbi:hypothetical protein ASF37_16400 [Aeromicrobium sp. Leaf289]|nr:hypothetical protein ASF37_16400 [Aeromicrobium sp. Leaf289]
MPTTTPTSRPATPPATAPWAHRASTGRSWMPSSGPDERGSRHPATNPASTGSRPSATTTSPKAPGAGRAASTGSPGTAPSWDPVRSTDVWDPRTKPGPSRTDVAQATMVGTASRQSSARAGAPARPGSRRAHSCDARSTCSTSSASTTTAAAASRTSAPRAPARTAWRTSARRHASGQRSRPRPCGSVAPSAAPTPETTKAAAAARTGCTTIEGVLATLARTAASTPQVPATVAANAPGESTGSGVMACATRAVSATHSSTPPSGTRPSVAPWSSRPEPWRTSQARAPVRSAGTRSAPLSSATPEPSTKAVITVRIAVRKPGRSGAVATVGFTPPSSR